MADKWKDLGECTDLIGLFDVFGIFPTEHLVENTETGEKKTAIVGRDQTVGEAISKGQWKKD